MNVEGQSRELDSLYLHFSHYISPNLESHNVLLFSLSPALFVSACNKFAGQRKSVTFKLTFKASCSAVIWTEKFSAFSTVTQSRYSPATARDHTHGYTYL